MRRSSGGAGGDRAAAIARRSRASAGVPAVFQVEAVEEAVEAVAALKPKIAVPMHYAAIVGSDADAKRFKSLVKNCQVEIL